MKLSHLLKRFLPYYGKYKKEIALDLFCALMTTGCEIVFPQIVRMITNQAVADYTQITTSWVLTLGGIYLLLRVIDTAANHFMQYWGHVTGAKLETDMRTDLFNHLQQLSFSYYNETKVGQIMARITSDLFDVTEFSHHCPEEFLIAGVKITASFIILCGMNVWLTLMVFLLLPFMLIGTRYFRRKMRAAFADARHQVGEINAPGGGQPAGRAGGEILRQRRFGNREIRPGQQEVFWLQAVSVPLYGRVQPRYPPVRGHNVYHGGGSRGAVLKGRQAGRGRLHRFPALYLHPAHLHPPHRGFLRTV
jgi:hypothetical protein